MTLSEFLRKIIEQHGPIPSVRVSSAQAKGRAKQYSYWGAVRYEIRINRRGNVSNCPLERATSDRRSQRLARDDALRIADDESRIFCSCLGELSRMDQARVLDALSRERGYPAAGAINEYLAPFRSAGKDWIAKMLAQNSEPSKTGKPTHE